MTTAELIAQFETYVDDMTELSSAQELILANKIYRKCLNNRPWEFLKKAYNGTANGISLALPADFAFITDNYSYTDDTIEQGGKYVFVNNNPYKVVNWSDRRQYVNNNNICYIDYLNGLLYFGAVPTAGWSVSFDYIHNPADLDLATSNPIFPARFHEIIYHGMCADDYIIQQSDKAKSYAGENLGFYKNYLDDMAYWNSQLTQI